MQEELNDLPAIKRGLEALEEIDGPDDWIPPCIHCGGEPRGYNIGGIAFAIYCPDCAPRPTELADVRSEESLDEEIADWRDRNIDWQP